MTPWPSEKIKRERKSDAEIAQKRCIEPWQLRRERYLVATGRARELVDEEQAEARKRKRAVEESAGSFQRSRREA